MDAALAFQSAGDAAQHHHDKHQEDTLTHCGMSLCLFELPRNTTLSLLQYLLEEKDRVWELVPDVFQLVMKYHARKMDYAMTPGLTQLTWTSLNLEPFLSKVQQAISQFERLTKQVSK